MEPHTLRFKVAQMRQLRTMTLLPTRTMARTESSQDPTDGDGDDDGAPFRHCVSPSMDGYTYGVVEIGDQCWFAENLRYDGVCG